MAKKKQGKKLQAKSSRSFPPNQHYNWLRNQQDVDDLERFVDEGRTLKDMATYFGTKVGRVESCLSDYNLLELRKANEKRMTRPIEKKIDSDFIGPPYDLSRDEINNSLTGESSSADTRVETPSQLESSSSNSENLFETPVATSDVELRKEVGLPSKPIYQLPKQSTVGRTSTQTPDRESASSSRSYSPYAPIIDGPGLTSPFVYDSSFVHPSINSMPQSTGSSPASRPASPAPTAQTETPQPSTQPQTTTQPKMTLWQNLRSSRNLLIKTLVGTAVLGAITLQATGHGFNFRSSKPQSSRKDSFVDSSYINSSVKLNDGQNRPYKRYDWTVDNALTDRNGDSILSSQERIHPVKTMVRVNMNLEGTVGNEVRVQDDPKMYILVDSDSLPKGPVSFDSLQLEKIIVQEWGQTQRTYRASDLKRDDSLGKETTAMFNKYNQIYRDALRNRID